VHKLLVAAMCALMVAASASVASAYYPYGAIASSAAQVYGYSRDMVSRGRAESAALAACQAHTHFTCFVRVWFAGHACGALARHGGGQGWGIGPTPISARANALRGANGGVILVTVCN
jgi:Domain of unknown function (DUF4189)